MFLAIIVILVVAIIAFILVDKGFTGPAAEFAWIAKLVIVLFALAALYYWVGGAGHTVLLR